MNQEHEDEAPLADPRWPSWPLHTSEINPEPGGVTFLNGPSWREKAALVFIALWILVAFLWGSWVMGSALIALARHLWR